MDHLDEASFGAPETVLRLVTGNMFAALRFRADSRPGLVFLPIRGIN
jgi:hypothetical protein